MLLISDGNSEIGAHVRSDLCYLICLRHLIKPSSVTNRIFFLPIFLHTCATYSELPFKPLIWIRIISRAPWWTGIRIQTYKCLSGSATLNTDVIPFEHKLFLKSRLALLFIPKTEILCISWLALGSRKKGLPTTRREEGGGVRGRTTKKKELFYTKP